MGRNNEKKIVGTVSLEEALAAFVDSSKENKSTLRRINELKNIIDRIVAERIYSGLTQRELSEMTGIKQPMIARFEKMDMFPRIDTLLKITDALDLKIYIEGCSDKNYISTECGFDSVIDYRDRKELKGEVCNYGTFGAKTNQNETQILG